MTVNSTVDNKRGYK